MPHPSLVFRWFTIGYILGVGIGSFCHPPVWWCFASLALPLVAVGWKGRPGIICGGLLIVGGALGAIHIGRTLEQRSANLVPGCCDREVMLAGVVKAEPAMSIGHQTITIQPEGSIMAPRPAKALVRLPLGQMINYGDVVEVKCRMSVPAPTVDFAYDKYLMLSNIRATCLAPYARIIGRQSSQTLMRLIFQAKRWTTERLQSALPEPQAALMAGLLIGSRSGLPEAVSDDFRRSGVSHIVAISGYNITIIAAMIFAATCRFAGRTRSFWLVAAVLVLFTIMTGAQASVIRAAIMGLLALTAKQVGRTGGITGVWLLAGLIMVAVNPMVLAFDAGFQLSFLATAGLIWVSPAVSRFLGWVPETIGLRDSLASTVSATALTLPIMLGNFRQVSLISPIANMLILPFIPTIMAAGAVIVGSAAVSAAVSQIIGWFGWLGLSYILSVTHWLGNMPFAAITISQSRAGLFTGLYGLVAGGLVIMRQLVNRRNHES